MKKGLIALMMVLAVGLNADAAAQKHRHSQTTTAVSAVADTAQQAQDEVVAFSDTTDATGTTGAAQADSVVYDNYSRVTLDDLDRLTLDDVDLKDVAGLLVVAAIVFFIVVLAPVLILLLIFWFIRKNRQDQLRMAEMAMKNGQPIPQELLKDEGKTDSGDSNDDLWQKGIRQTFLGIGLMFFLGYTAGDVGVGIGILVTCLGVGKLAIVKTSGMKKNPEDRPGHQF